MNEQQVKASEISSAISDILEVHQNTIIVRSIEAAEILSDLYLTASDSNVGQITGPYMRGNNKAWHIEI